MANPSNSPRVLCTMGHGCDFVDQPSKVVPRGCKYITIGLCGMTSIDLPKILYAFQDELVAEALKYPDDPAILSILADYFEFPFDTVMRVHNEGDIYTDSNISLWTNFITTYFKSGIYELGHIPKGPLYMNREDRSPITHPRNADDELYEFVYAGSLWRPETKYGNINIKYSELMERNVPAIYYHFACRSACNPTHANVNRNLKLKRQQSVSRIERSGINIEKGQMGQIIDPTIYLQKATRVIRFAKWVNEHVTIPENRSKWTREIKNALDAIEKRRSPEMNTVNSALAAVASNQPHDSIFSPYLAIPPAAARVVHPRYNMLHRNDALPSLLSSMSSMSLQPSAAASSTHYEHNDADENDLPNYINTPPPQLPPRTQEEQAARTARTAQVVQALQAARRNTTHKNRINKLSKNRRYTKLITSVQQQAEKVRRTIGKTHRKKSNRNHKQTHKRK